MYQNIFLKRSKWCPVIQHEIILSENRILEWRIKHFSFLLLSSRKSIVFNRRCANNPMEYVQCLSWRILQQTIENTFEIKKCLSFKGLCRHFGQTQILVELKVFKKLEHWYITVELKLTTSKKFRSDRLLVEKTLQVKILETSSNIYHM